MDLQDLLDIEAIKQLKYRYMRSVDTRDFDLLESCLAPDATSSYGDGKYSFDGRDAIMGFLRGALVAESITLHTAHHPEITLTGDGTATGIWVLEDWVLNTTKSSKLHGAAHYRDRYVKIDGEWKIAATGNQRLLEDRSAFGRHL